MPEYTGLFNKNFLLKLNKNMSNKNKSKSKKGLNKKEKEKTTLDNDSENDLSKIIDPLKFDKDLCKSIFSSLPSRKQIKYQALKNLIK